jgi:hypothetical protein
MIPQSLARDKLELWQKQQYGSLDLRPPVQQDPKSLIRSLIEPEIQDRTAGLLLIGKDAPANEIEHWSRLKVLEMEGLLKESPPTKFEDIPTYLNILFVAQRLEEGTRNSADHVVLKRPIFGTLPSGPVNAQTVFRGSEYFVAFSSGLFSFGRFIGRLVAKTLRYTGVSTENLARTPNPPFFTFSGAIDDLRGSIERDPEDSEFFTDALLSSIRSGRAYLPKMPDLDPIRHPVATAIYTYFLEFVVAHEYGHIVYKHIEEARQEEPDSGTSLRPIMYHWRKECEADWAAVALLQGARKKVTNLAAVLGGINIFLSFFEIVERALSLLCFGDEDRWLQTEEHPPARTRRRFLHRSLILRANELLEGKDAQAQMRLALNEGPALVSRIVDLLWEQARPRIWQSYELGLAVSPIFHRISDATDSTDPAMLDAARERIKNGLVGVYGPLEQAEQLLVSGKQLIRSCSRALFSEKGRLPLKSEAAHAAVIAALGQFGKALDAGAQALSALRPILVPSAQTAPDLLRIVTDKVALAGLRLHAASPIAVSGALLQENSTLIHEAAQSLFSMGEKTGVYEYLRLIAQSLWLSGQGLLQREVNEYWKAVKVTGFMTVLWGESLIQKAFELGRVRLLAMIGKALPPAAIALRKDQVPDLGSLRDVLSLYKEAMYAVANSMRRSGSFCQNIDELTTDLETLFRENARVFTGRAEDLDRCAAQIAESETALNTARQGRLGMAETGRLLESAVKNLRATVEQAALAQALSDIAQALSSAEAQPIQAAQLLEKASRNLPTA